MASQNIDPARVNTTTQEKKRETTEHVSGGLHSVTRRLQQDLMTLMMSGEKTVSAFPDGDNLFHWKATISGAAGTVYEGLEYKLSFEFPDQYPYMAPTVKFITPCYHPNIDQAGNICLDILKEKWSALMDVRTILLSIQVLLSAPNNESPLNSHAAQLWEDQIEYKRVLLEKYKQQVKNM